MSPMPRALLPALFVLAACSDLASFRGDYSGEVAGAVVCEDEPCSFIRRGFEGGTELRLRAFDPAVQSVDLAAGSAPGFLTTDDADPSCAADVTPTFVDEPLRPIGALAHDALSGLEIPGATRVRTYVYALEPERGPLAGRHALAFVTLLEDEEVEVRIIAGDGATDCAALAARNPPEDPCVPRAAGACDYFGLFELRRD